MIELILWCFLIIISLVAIILSSIAISKESDSPVEAEKRNKLCY